MNSFEQLGLAMANHAFSVGVALGASLGLGGGAGIITFLHHMPAPYKDQEWMGAIYDTLQDRIKNMDRIGVRRERPAKQKGGADDQHQA